MIKLVHGKCAHLQGRRQEMKVGGFKGIKLGGFSPPYQKLGGFSFLIANFRILLAIINVELISVTERENM